MDVASAAGQRFVLSSDECSTQLELARKIAENDEFASWPLPTAEAKAPKTRAVYSAARAKRVLGLTFRPIHVTLLDMARAMRDMGMAGPVKRGEL